MSRAVGFSSPFLLGFEEFEQVLDRVAKSSSEGYPPYNIERNSGKGGGGDGLRISLAVAGFTVDDLDVSVEENQLIVRGQIETEDADRVFLHRGIAARQFQRAFLLADGIEIVRADLRDGLLAIDLVRPTPNKKTRKIDISCDG